VAALTWLEHSWDRKSTCTGSAPPVPALQPPAAALRAQTQPVSASAPALGALSATS
jgi:hypothetical protein